MSIRLLVANKNRVCGTLVEGAEVILEYLRKSQREAREALFGLISD